MHFSLVFDPIPQLSPLEEKAEIRKMNYQIPVARILAVLCIESGKDINDGGQNLVAKI